MTATSKLPVVVACNFLLPTLCVVCIAANRMFNSQSANGKHKVRPGYAPEYIS